METILSYVIGWFLFGFTSLAVYLAFVGCVFRRELSTQCVRGLSFIAAFALSAVALAPNVWAGLTVELKEEKPANTAPQPDESAAEDHDQPLAEKIVVLREDQRPEWVTQTITRNGDGPDATTVSSTPWKTRHECEQAIQPLVKKAVDEYVNWYLNETEAATRLDLDDDFIQEHLVRATYIEDIQFVGSPVGAMKELHMLLEFDERFQDELSVRWENEVKSARMMQAGLMTAGVLGLLVAVFGFLKTDTATRGAYAGRLKLAAGGVILALLTAGVLASRWVPWL